MNSLVTKNCGLCTNAWIKLPLVPAIPGSSDKSHAVTNRMAGQKKRRQAQQRRTEFKWRWPGLKTRKPGKSGAGESYALQYIMAIVKSVT